MLKTRLVVGGLLIAALAALAAVDSAFPVVWIASQRIGPGAILIFVALLPISVILAGEFSRLTGSHPAGSNFRVGGGQPLSRWLSYLAIASGVASVALAQELLPAHLVAPALLSTPFVLVTLCALNHARSKQVAGLAHAVGSTLLAYGAIGVPLGFWILLRHDRDAWTLAGAILCVKSADIGAYFAGCAIGRHKMVPWLSPAKTWEGFLAGVAVSAGVGWALAVASQSAAAANAFVEPVAIGYAVVVAVVIGVVGTCGDLFESCLKREAGVKDSGTILPGMGGLYDVFDSLLPAGPLAWWLLTR